MFCDEITLCSFEPRIQVSLSSAFENVGAPSTRRTTESVTGIIVIKGFGNITLSHTKCGPWTIIRTMNNLMLYIGCFKELCFPMVYYFAYVKRYFHQHLRAMYHVTMKIYKQIMIGIDKSR